MQLENTFTIPAGIDEAWAAFNDPARVAPCFPGATLQSCDGDSFTGTVKIELGRISLTYKGQGSFVERDEAAHRVVIDASGRVQRGNGTASAKVTGTMTADGPARTTVTMVTDMTFTGRAAQFGREVMADVSDKIVGQFASCLAAELGPGAQSSDPTAHSAAHSAAESAAEFVTPGIDPASTGARLSLATAAPAASVPASSNGAAPKLTVVPDPARGEVDAIDLLDSAGVPVLKRVVPAFLSLLLLFVVVRRLRRRP